MKTLTKGQIEEAIYFAAAKMCFSVDEKVLNRLNSAYETETGVNAKLALKDIIDNASVAKTQHIPLCQDTGIVIAFAEIGRDLHLDCDLLSAINDGLARAYVDEYLRKSVVSSPIKRLNTKNNTPCILHEKTVDGDNLKITLCPKGAGSENMGKVAMLNPSDGIEGIISFVTSTVKAAGGKACPPIIVGVGIGGDMEKCAIMSKEALLRDVDDVSISPYLKELENTLLEKINQLNIGAMGLKGKTTALAVKVNEYPCHIASLPVAVSIMCHAARHKTVIL